MPRVARAGPCRAHIGCLGGPVDEREDPVSGVLRTAPAVLLHQPVDDFVMGIELATPTSITRCAELFR